MSYKRIIVMMTLAVLIGTSASTDVFALFGRKKCARQCSSSCSAHQGIGKYGYHGKSHGKESKPLHGVLFEKAGFMLKHSDALDLSKEQKKSIGQLKTKIKKTMIRRKAEVEALAVDIRAKLHEEKADAAAIHALVDKKYAEKKKLSKAIIDALIELKGIPTKQQWEKFKELKQTKHKYHKN